jgi:hypothetical protein
MIGEILLRPKADKSEVAILLQLSGLKCTQAGLRGGLSVDSGPKKNSSEPMIFIPTNLEVKVI